MSENDHSDERPASGGGVFGNLPGSRPGARSPRRATSGSGPERPARSKPASAKAKPKPKPRTAPRGRPASEPAESPRRPPGEEGERPAPQGDAAEHGREGAGLDDLAWAGVAAAAEAATIGVRLANRALGALRRPADRR